jgi:hypothetical protein
MLEVCRPGNSVEITNAWCTLDTALCCAGAATSLLPLLLALTLSHTHSFLRSLILDLSLTLTQCRGRRRFERPRDRVQRRFADKMERIKWEKMQPGFVPESLASE